MGDRPGGSRGFHHGEVDDDSAPERRPAALRGPGAGQDSQHGDVQTASEVGHQVSRADQNRGRASENDRRVRELPLPLPDQLGSVLLHPGGEGLSQEASLPVPRRALQGIHKFVQKTRKLYLDTRTQRNPSKLNSELNEVQSIMTKNIQEVLGQGEKLENVTRMSSTLSYESRKYQKNAKALSRQALIKKYMPFAIIGGVIFMVLFFRWLFY